uniref:Uncharacterized protein n=1 Tax=Salix viminalis TaxID=40686 RepID=A0A6N2KJD9_SALVM
MKTQSRLNAFAEPTRKLVRVCELTREFNYLGPNPVGLGLGREQPSPSVKTLLKRKTGQRPVLTGRGGRGGSSCNKWCCVVVGRSSGRLQHQLLTSGLAASSAAGERMREGVVVEEREGVVAVAVEERGGAVVTACGEREGQWLWRREREL